NVLAPVRLSRNDRRYAIRVVDLETDLVSLDKLSDRDHALWCRDQGVIGLARRALRALLKSDVEPHRRVERGHLVQQDVDQLVLEGLGVVVGGEVAVVASPACDRPGYAPD